MLTPRRISLALLLVSISGCGDGPTFPPGIAHSECGELAIMLEPGQSAAPSEGGSICALQPAPGAEYALGWLDTRAIASAETTLERHVLLRRKANANA